MAFLAPVASFIVNELASNVFSAGFGWVLGQFGESNGLDDQMGPIRDKLDAIDSRLSALEASTDQLRTELAEANFNHLAADANNIVGQINYAMDRLNTIANWPAYLSQVDKKLTAEDLKKYIRDNLLDKQHVLDLKIAPAVGEGLIQSAYKVEKSHIGLFWTRTNWFHVRDVLDYYQDEEARLLLLRVEYWHSAGYSGDFIRNEIAAFERTLQNQDLLLKPRPLANMLVDTRSDHDWLLSDLFRPATIDRALEIQAGYARARQDWRLPSEAEVRQYLIKGWRGKNWAEWTNNEIGGQLTVPCCFEGVWTNQYANGRFIAITGTGAITYPADGKLMGVLLMRNRPSELVGGKYTRISYW